MTVVAIIPARGGSKGIPRKNLRPLAGKPMIYYSIRACLDSNTIKETVVTTDDDEIALIARRFGAKVLMRDSRLADDLSTLDIVIVDAIEQLENKFNLDVSLIVTVQPTSPLIRAVDIDHGVALFSSKNTVDTVISVVDDRHLCWTITDGLAHPAYKERVNRQQLKPNLRETGAVIACTRNQLSKGTRIGSKVRLLEIEKSHSFDIDDFSDFYLCENILQRKKIVFTVIGYDEVGLGHAFRAVMLANELIKYNLVFVCEEKSYLAKHYIESFNYKVDTCSNGKLIDSVLAYNPDLVINDILDTKEKYINQLKNSGIKVVNFEDLGSGCEKADLVINALYPTPLPYEHVKVGVKYFCLRDEFLYGVNLSSTKEKNRKILITFGGVDEGNLTKRTAKLIAPWCVKNEIKLTIVLGPGYTQHESLFCDELSNNWVDIVKNTKCISEYMIESSLAITSGGRTVLELAALNIPMVVICQNNREELHTFASKENGIINLGFRENVDDKVIFDAVLLLLEDNNFYELVKKKLREFDLSHGKKRVCNLINSLLTNGE